jgi:Methyltransferase domain
VIAREPAPSRVFTVTPRDTPGLDWREASQVELVRELGAQEALELPEDPTSDERDCHNANGMLSRWDAWPLQFTCIDPYPMAILQTGLDGVSKLITSPVEELALDEFLELRRDDILFIDCSHTVKTGGDVVFLFQEVVPRLAPGVLIHIHDNSAFEIEGGWSLWIRRV